MKLYRSKCNTCGDFSYIFPDQIEEIKRRPNLMLHKFVGDGKLKINDKWFCIKCDSGRKNGKDCYIYAELTGDEARKKIKIRSRATNLQSMGFELPGNVLH
jgi:hypothetical protein